MCGHYTQTRALLVNTSNTPRYTDTHPSVQHLTEKTTELKGKKVLNIRIKWKKGTSLITCWASPLVSTTKPRTFF